MPLNLAITGMHRSGTSLFAGLVAGAGIDLGENLMPAGRGNRRGHFEDLAFVRFHEGFLNRRGVGSLSPPAAWSPVPTPAEESEARSLVARRSVKPVWGFKDPRTSLFLDFWDPLLPAPFYLFVFRHPVEVALSLLRRGIDLEVQLDPWTAIRAWTVYNSELLRFRLVNPERAALWHLSGALASLPSVLGGLGDRLGLALVAAGDLYAPADLRQGLWAPGIDWGAILPEAMALYGRLEGAADVPGGPPADPAERPQAPPRRERDLLETNEHLLAAALIGTPADAPVEVSRVERIDFSELRLLADRQEGRLAEVSRQVAAGQARLREIGEGWARVEATRSWRLLSAYWSAAGRARAWRRQLGWRLRRRLGAARPPLPEECLIGCVAENDPRFLAAACRLVQSIRWFGGALAGARVWVCVVGDVAAGWRQTLESYGAEVRVVRPFDRRNPSANKLQFLSAALGSGAGTLVLFDCDMVVVRDPLPLFRGGALQAKIADVPSVTHETFERLFRHYGLALPERRYRTTLLPVPTIPYCNSAMVVLPAGLAREFVPVWRDYNARILESLDLLGSCAHHCHQASLSLALAACPIPFDEAPPALNFPLHLTHIPPSRELLASDPAILHYHQMVDDEGYLLPSRYPRAQARIEAFNRRLQEERERRP